MLKTPRDTVRISKSKFFALILTFERSEEFQLVFSNSEMK